MSDSLQPHGLQHARPPCPSTYPGADFFTLLFHFHQEALSFFFALKPQTCINIGVQRVFGWWIQIHDMRMLCSLRQLGSANLQSPLSYTLPPFHSLWIFNSINLRTVSKCFPKFGCQFHSVIEHGDVVMEPPNFSHLVTSISNFGPHRLY